MSLRDTCPEDQNVFTLHMYCVCDIIIWSRFRISSRNGLLKTACITAFFRSACVNRGHETSQFGGDQTMQMYGVFEGFPL